ncbi:sentrin-specific protease 8-like [Ctenocephalides felis]|uniref:sentrin-specific protease 8-like n=1 Tax=Ctenocephalides felis TaxID=7515 RepID=UPI000E6E1885|nr:sentrin-specific protease 8-like [Ctenocephalides felis]
MDKEKIVLSFNESLLRMSDIELLKGPFWLNDTLISFYLEYLEKVAYAGENYLLFVSPEVTQCIKIISNNEVDIFLAPLKVEKRQFIFFVVNDNNSAAIGGSHWSLLVYSRPETCFFHFDSSLGCNRAPAYNIARVLAEYLTANPGLLVEDVTTLQQDNGYDCGVHVLCNIDLVADHISKYNKVRGCGVSSKKVIDGKRYQILNVIKELGGNII